MIIAFDVDDTLIIPSVATGFTIDTPNYETLALLRWYEKQGHGIIIWSGGGVDYAKMWAEKLGINPLAVIRKDKEEAKRVTGQYIDIAYDDCDVDLAIVNVKVKRVSNNISRAEWNKH